MKAIIAGGGIGGLNAALCLHRIGWEIVVLEQAQQLNEVGAGIQISPNGTKVLRELGVLDELQSTLFKPEGLEMRSRRTGKPVFPIPLQEAAQ